MNTDWSDGGDRTRALRLMWWIKSRFAYCVPHKQQTGRGEDTGQTDQEVNKTKSHSRSSDTKDNDVIVLWGVVFMKRE